MDAVIELLKYIQPAIPLLTTMAALIATLFAVYLTNKAHEKRLKQQLEHDTNQRIIERELVLRREIYLDAAEKLGKGMEFIGAFANWNFDHQKAQALIEGLTGSMNKIHLVGTMETIAGLSNAMQYFSNATYDLNLRRSVIDVGKQELQNIEGQINNQSAFRDKILADMNELVRFEIFNQDAYDNLRLVFDDTQTRLDGLTESHKRKNLNVLRNLQEISKVTISQTLHFGLLLSEACIAVREELGMTIDEKQYREFQRASSKRSQQRCEEFIEQLRVMISEQDSPNDQR
jgi:hypothetical protein